MPSGIWCSCGQLRHGPAAVVGADDDRPVLGRQLLERVRDEPRVEHGLRPVGLLAVGRLVGGPLTHVPGAAAVVDDEVAHHGVQPRAGRVLLAGQHLGVLPRPDHRLLHDVLRERVVAGEPHDVGLQRARVRLVQRAHQRVGFVAHVASSLSSSYPVNDAPGARGSTAGEPHPPRLVVPGSRSRGGTGTEQRRPSCARTILLSITAAVAAAHPARAGAPATTPRSRASEVDHLGGVPRRASTRRRGDGRRPVHRRDVARHDRRGRQGHDRLLLPQGHQGLGRERVLGRLRDRVARDHDGRPTPRRSTA